MTKVLFIHNLGYFVVNKTKLITLLYKNNIFLFNCNPKFSCSKIPFYFYTIIEICLRKCVESQVCGIPSAFLQCEILSVHHCNSPLLLAKLRCLGWPGWWLRQLITNQSLCECECSEQSFVLAQFNSTPTPFHPRQKQDFYWNWNMI